MAKTAAPAPAAEQPKAAPTSKSKTVSVVPSKDVIAKATAAKKTLAKKAPPTPSIAPKTLAKAATTTPLNADKTAKKPKLVRDSFTIPKAEYNVLDDLKQRAAQLAHGVTKSELIRAGIKALAAMPDAAFLKALAQVPAIKTGRPAADS